jgi:thiamine pyrophosphate-dependent acetolactate synthase large subunit-like protein
MPTVAETLVKTLAAAGVKRIYGIVGDSLNGITNELRRQKTIPGCSALCSDYSRPPSRKFERC